MPTIQFMPWCPINKKYQAGDITIIPFATAENSEHSDELTVLLGSARTILALYRDIEGQAVSNMAVIQYASKPILSNLTDDEIGVTKDCLVIVCFSGLVNRAYFDPLGPDCNADCFISYGHKFQGDPTFSGITSRRLEGRTIDVRSLDKLLFSIPVHASGITEIILDESMLSSLLDYRRSSSDSDWTRWQNALACFNQANTDSDTVSEQVEWVLLCSAFERLLNAKSNAKDVAHKFTDVFKPDGELLIRDAKRKLPNWNTLTKPLRCLWLREFYGVRGDFAHGRLQTRQPMAWNLYEHLALAKTAFPLLAKCLLAQSGKYTLTENDHAQIDAFEHFADDPFLQRPPDQEGSMDSWWNRHLIEAKGDRALRRAVDSWNTNSKP